MYEYIFGMTNGPVRYEPSGRGHIKMTHKAVPYSILPKEFELMVFLIRAFNLQRGVEIGTAFGVSSLAAGIGFHTTGGKLVTIDAYIEEAHNNAGTYEGKTEVYRDSDGYKSAKFLHETVGVDKHVDVRYGWSPTDVPNIVRDVHGNDPIDYAFIDGGHFTEQILDDAQVVASLVGENFVVLFHDVYDSFFPKHEEIEQMFGGRKLEVVLPYPYGENMGLITTYDLPIEDE